MIRILILLVLPCLVPPVLRAQGKGRSFDGLWSTSYGPMQLAQRGARVTGHYTFAEKKVSGTVEDGELVLDYGSGEARFGLWKDADVFTGKYTAANGRSGTWGGYRIRPRVAKPTPGKITSGQSKSWLNYHLRVPKKYDGKKRYPAIGFLHGSNMSSRAYVNTIAVRWPRLAEDFILVGFDGERLNGASKPGRPAFNFTYVNFSGHEKGEKWRYRQSPVLVGEALDELKGQFPIDRWYLGGHSQGGFLTYAVFMFYPDSVAGVFPMSCNLLVQCDPDWFEDEALREKQRRVAIAIVHGENDGVVKFSGGEWCHRAMIDGGFPAVRFFTHATAGHRFAHLPVQSAVRWLESITASDPTDLIAFAEKQVAAGEFRDASAALTRVRDLGVPSDLRFNFERVAAKIDAKARPQAKRLTKAIRENENNGWVDAFLEFRAEFAFADAAAEVMAAYAELRRKHAKKAQELFYAARRGDRESKYQEIVDKYYASKWYAHVKAWLDE